MKLRIFACALLILLLVIALAPTVYAACADTYDPNGTLIAPCDNGGSFFWEFLAPLFDSVMRIFGGGYFNY
jgi:hypothetical protein